MIQKKQIHGDWRKFNPNEKWLTTSKVSKRQKTQSRKPHKTADEQQHEKIAEEKLISTDHKSPKSKMNKNCQRLCSTDQRAKYHVCVSVCILRTDPESCTPHSQSYIRLLLSRGLQHRKPGISAFFWSVTGKPIPEILRICQLLFWLPFLKRTYFYILIRFTILHMCALHSDHSYLLPPCSTLSILHQSL